MLAIKSESAYKLRKSGLSWLALLARASESKGHDGRSCCRGRRPWARGRSADSDRDGERGRARVPGTHGPGWWARRGSVWSTGTASR